MFNSKTVALSRGQEVELPSADFALNYNGGANKQGILISEITEVLNSAMFPLDEAMLPQNDCQTLLEAVLWDEDYPFEVRNELATKFYKNEEATICWTFQYGKGQDLWNIAASYTMDVNILPYAIHNPNYTPEVLKIMFDFVYYGLTNRFIKDLTSEAFTAEVMVWLLETAEFYKTEEVVKARIAKILGLPETTPATWLSKVAETLPQSLLTKTELQNV